MIVKTLLSIAILSAALALQATEYYAAPSLVSKGDGSISNPWDLQTALHQSSVKSGDTIWLRGGVHRRSFVNAAGAKVGMPTRFDSTLLGSSSAPITVRAYPGEQPTIDGNLQQNSGGYVTFWGVEIMDSLPGRYTAQSGPWPTDWWIMQDGKTTEFCVSGVSVGGNPDQGAAWVPGMKFINCIVHDNIGGGFGLSRSSAGVLTYGCLVYYNGWRGYNTTQATPQNHGHGYYIQHAGTTQTVVKNCFSFQNYSQGSQYYGTTAGYTDYGTFDSVVEWQNSHFQPTQQRNFEYGNGAGAPSVNPIIINCMVYDSRGSGSDSEFGDGSGMNNTIFTNNYFGSPVNFNGPISGNISGNSFMGGINGSVSSGSNPNNTFGSGQPTSGTKIAVYPNAYETGRGNIAIFNWGKASTVQVDVSKVGLNVGDTYELHQAEDYFRDITTGTYTGSPITINMTGHTVATPVGANTSTDPNVSIKTQPSSFPTFGAFVIMKKSGGTVTPPSNTAPTVTSIGAQATKTGTAVGPLSFTIGDAQSAASSLAVTAMSSNPTLIPSSNVVLGGSGASRTITVTPVSGQSGSATITVTVADGTTSTSTSFGVTVTAAPITISKIANQSIAINQSVAPIAFTVSSSTATVAASSSNTGLLPNANLTLGGTGTARTLTIKPAANQSGKAMVTVTAAVGTQAASVSFTVSVDAPPAISSIANQTVMENVSSPAIAFTVGDSETPATNLFVAASSSNPTLVPASGIVLGGSGASRTLKLTPATNQTGTATIVVSVSDSVLTSSTNFVLTVKPTATNTPPATNQALVALGIEASSAAIMAPMTVASDPQMPARKYITPSSTNGGTATYSVNIPVAGTYVIWCKVLAPSYTNDSFFVSVDGAEDVYDEAEGKQSPNWQWTQVTGRSGGTTAAALNPRTFTLSQGKHTIVFRSREAYAMVNRFIVCNSLTYVPTEVTATNDTVSVLANGASQIDPAELMANDKSTFGDKLTVSAVSLAKTGTVTMVSGMINYTAKQGFVGKDSFTYTVTDGMGGNGSATVSVNVQATNSVRLGFDAVAGTLAAPMAIVADPDMASRKMIKSAVANSGSATFNVSVPKTGTFYLWNRVLSPSYTNDSFTVTVNGVSDVYDTAEGLQSTNWQWSCLNGRNGTSTPKTLNPRVLALTSGNNTIVFAGREVGAGLDRLVLTDDSTFIPKDVITVNDSVSAFAGVTTPISTTDLLRNDYSLFGDPIVIKSVGTAKNGIATLVGTSISYTPKAGYKGTDQFTYIVSDNLGGSSTGTVTVTVQ